MSSSTPPPAAAPVVSAPLNPDGITPLDPARLRAVAARLPATPNGPGKPITERRFWGALAALPPFQKVVGQAETLLKEPLPEQSDDLYLEFSRTGNRVNWERVATARRRRLPTLVLAECVENKGRFLPAIEALISALCAERTWVLPATDEKLKNFHGEITEIELFSSMLAWDLATADYLLGAKLPSASRETLRANIKRRVLDPFRTMIRGQSSPVFLHGQRKGPSSTMFWLTASHNWNPVCLGGVTGAALLEIPSREERAEFVVAAETYTRHFLSGFTSDGYCSEGLAYWGYGFGRYVLLSEILRQATNGGVNLLARPEAQKPATYPARIEIGDGIYPAFADCGVFAKPAPPTMYVLQRRLGLTGSHFTPEAVQTVYPSLFETLIYSDAAEEGKVMAAKPVPTDIAPLALRDWFDQAGVLVARPAPGSPGRFAVALKGGHNAETHNHNDVGSFVVVVGDRPVLLDPGAETYSARTFSPRRYESKLLNSYGHSVPIVAGILQKTGRDAQARVLQTDFTDAKDMLSFDLTSAYPVQDLKSLHRTFTYARAKEGSLTVADRVELKAPQTFGTALLTLGTWERQPDGSLIVTDHGASVKVSIDTQGKDYTVDAETIREDAPVTPTRLGINLKEPVTTATITLTITPLPKNKSKE